MKNLKISKVILFVVTIALLVSITIDARAEDGLTELTPNTPIGNLNTNNSTNNTSNNTSNNTKNTSNVSNVNKTNTSNRVNTTAYINNSNSSLPKTGAEDYTTVFIIVGVCIVSAVYAYKKANEYNGLR